MSNTVLQAMVNDADDGLVQVSGPPWTDGKEFKGVGAGALVARILCTFHNSCLSALDAEACQLWTAIREMTRPDAAAGQRVLLNGHDIERWIFKFLCGQLVSGVSRCPDGSKVTGDWFPDQQLEMIADHRSWQTRTGCGLYYMSTRQRLAHLPSIGFRPIVSEANRAVLGARIGICGLDFLLVASPHLDRTYPAGFVRKYRPAGFRFTSERGRSELLFSWNDRGTHRMVTIGQTGSTTLLNYPHPESL